MAQGQVTPLPLTPTTTTTATFAAQMTPTPSQLAQMANQQNQAQQHNQLQETNPSAMAALVNARLPAQRTPPVPVTTPMGPRQGYFTVQQ